MPDRVPQPARVQYLEGLRGIAAAQVVALHFVTAFLPDTADNGPQALRLLWDGHTAVYVFFLISGAVLTPSFARGGPWQRQAAKRLIRLGVPVAAAAVCALVLLAALPDAHLRAARISGSGWLAMDSSGAPTVPHLLREIGLDSLILGYREYTLFTPLAAHLPLLQNSLDAPFWSLHLELYGSLLVLGLVRLRAASRAMHAAIVLLCAAVFGTHPMFLFVIGHLLSFRLRGPPVRLRGPPVRLAGVALIGLGLALAAGKDWSAIEAMRIAITRVSPIVAPNLYQFQSQLAAVALFGGVLLSPAAHRVLEARLFRDLGRLSFSVYLLHFPILFTVACAAFIPLAGALPYPAALTITVTGFVVLLLITAAGFERWIDRAAVRLGRRVDGRAKRSLAYQ